MRQTLDCYPQSEQEHFITGNEGGSYKHLYIYISFHNIWKSVYALWLSTVISMRLCGARSKPSLFARSWAAPLISWKMNSMLHNALRWGDWAHYLQYWSWLKHFPHQPHIYIWFCLYLSVYKFSSWYNHVGTGWSAACAQTRQRGYQLQKVIYMRHQVAAGSCVSASLLEGQLSLFFL